MKQKVKIIQVLKKNFGIFLVILLSFWAIKPLFVNGFFPMHDDTQVARVFEMGKALKDGVFPVRWVADLGYGYGYPIFNFYAPLAYYIGGFFTLLGFDALIATKIMMVVGIVLSGIFMYLLAKEFWGETGGVLSGLFYVYAPYHALDIFVRGDVAEFWAYAFIPLVFYGVYKIYNDYKNYKKWIVVGSLGFAGVIISHNLTALMITPFLLACIFIYCFIAPKEKKLLIAYRLSLIAFLGLGISSFYWIPALAEIKYTNVLSQVGGGADFRDHFVCLQQLWSSPWGFGGSTKGCIDGLSFMIGKLHIFSVFSSIPILIYLKFKHKNFNNIYYSSIFSIAGFLISIFLMLEVSKFIWQAIPLMAFFQYPWRFLILASFFSSFLSGFTIWFLKKTAVNPAPTTLRGGHWRISRALWCGVNSHFNTLMYYSTTIFVFSLLFFNIKFFVPQTIFPATSTDFTNEIALKWTASKISDEFLPTNFKKPKSEKDIAKNSIPFKETTLERASNVVSLIGALVLIIGIIFKYAKTKR